MIHKIKSSKPQVYLMWFDSKCKTEQVIKFNTKIEVRVGDFLESGTTEEVIRYEILEILEEGPSKLSGFSYVTAKSIRKIWKDTI